MYDMITQMVILRDAISVTLLQCRLKEAARVPIDPTPADWVVAKAISTALAPFKRATVDLSGEYYCTMAAALPMMFGLITKMVKIELANQAGNHCAAPTHSLTHVPLHCADDVKMVGVFAKALREDLVKRLSVAGERKAINSAIISTLLHPGYSDMPGFDDASREGAEANILRMMEVEKDVKRVAPARPAAAAAAADSEDDDLVPPLPAVVLDEAATELDTFCRHPRAGKRKASQPWWVSHAAAYPRLAPIARRWLPVPATEAACERVWSIAGNILNPRRRSLTHAHLAELLFIHENWPLFERFSN